MTKTNDLSMNAGPDALIAMNAQGPRCAPSEGFGATLHLFVSLVAAAVYAALAGQWPSLVRHPLLFGAAFVVACYAVMSYLVLPLSAAPSPRAGDPRMIALSLGVPIAAFGWPIALVTHLLTRCAAAFNIRKPKPRAGVDR